MPIGPYGCMPKIDPKISKYIIYNLHNFIFLAQQFNIGDYAPKYFQVNQILFATKEFLIS